MKSKEKDVSADIVEAPKNTLRVRRSPSISLHDAFSPIKIGRIRAKRVINWLKLKLNYRKLNQSLPPLMKFPSK